MVRYWYGRVPDDEFEYVLENSCFLMQYQYGREGSDPVTTNWRACQKIQAGDYILLGSDGENPYIYAIGKVSKPLVDTTGHAEHECTMESVIANAKGEYNSGFVFYSDSDVFYESLDSDNGFNGTWGQRLDVEKWEYYTKGGVSNSGIADSVLNATTRQTIFEVKKEYFLEKKALLKEQYMSTLDDYQKMILNCISLLKSSLNIVLTGSPGTGKTHASRDIAAKIIFSNNDILYSTLNDSQKAIFNSRCGFVQFHPSYDYTDFVEGLRPVINGGSNIGFERRDGIFKVFCKEALLNKGKPFVFIIDEINRGEVSKILGELFYAIEPGYRGAGGRIKTQYQGLLNSDDPFYDGFYVSENVFIIGTSNDIDRSVESMDFAIRRRFAWVNIRAKDTAQSMWKSAGINDALIKENTKRMTALNEKICTLDELGESYELGGAYFILKGYFDKVSDNTITTRDYYKKLWDVRIMPLLKEYIRGQDNEKSILKTLEDAYNG